MKQEKNERVEVYYERLLKLTNSLQHKTTNSFPIICLQIRITTIFESSNNRHEERNLIVAQGNNFGL
jgi:hypothetical protein